MGEGGVIPFSRMRPKQVRGDSLFPPAGEAGAKRRMSGAYRLDWMWLRSTG